MKRFFLILQVVLLCLFLNACGASSQDSSTPQASLHLNTIQNTGSDTMVNLALAWAEQYQKEQTDINISVTGGGSGTGIASLLNGTIDIANASRSIKAEEIATAEENGFEPVEFIVARDAIAVIVNPQNPVTELTLGQISKIFQGQINNWKEVGGEDRPIVRVSRETNSGTHTYFLERVIRLNDKNDHSIFSADTLLLPSSEGIIAEVRDNPNAIGYDGLGYVIPEVKTIAVAEDVGQPYILPSVETVNDNTYPVARDLYMYTRGQPTGIVKDYIDWIYLPKAQSIVLNLGFIPYQR